MKNWLKLSIIGLLLLLVSGLAPGYRALCETKPYGVFLSIDREDADKLKDYRLVVIDGQYFTADDIAKLHQAGKRVYSYLNIGSVENFRSYYKEFEGLFLGEYENWEEEQWVDVADANWQEHIAGLAEALKEKGIDGFFIDNCDVYYVFPRKEIFDGLTRILRKLKAQGMDVVINGGDYYVDAYYREYGTVNDVLSGINQECVFSLIDFSSGKLKEQTPETKAYYQEYITKYAGEGLDIYLLEYTKNPQIMNRIHDFCQEKGFEFYISDSVELD